MLTNTEWERLPVTGETLKYLRGAYAVYSRLSDGQQIFQIKLDGDIPGESDGGYFSIVGAFQAKGLI